MREDHFEVLRELENHHALFGQFWTVGTVLESDRIPTACISFDKEGRGIEFTVNPEFWSKLTTYEKTFVIGHECLHIYFDHGRRMINGNLDQQLANIAGDVVINHYLCNSFGFDRNRVSMWKDYCWLETVFAPEKVKKQIEVEKAKLLGSGIDDIKELEKAMSKKIRPLIKDGVWDNKVDANRSMEYYYFLLEEQQQEGGGGGKGGKGEKGEGEGNGLGSPKTVDDHSGWADMDPNEVKEILDAMQEVVDQVTDRISNEEIEDFEDKIQEGNPEEQQKAQQAGTMGGAMKKKIRLGHVIKKRKWETIVADVVGRFMKMTEEVEVEQWAMPARRLSGMGGGLMLPSMMEMEFPRRDRVDLWFFQDTSGSCVDYAKRFFKAAATIPEDKFRIRGFCFDTRTYEVDFKKGELQGFGGTRFDVIEHEIQRRVKEEKCQYPQAVFVITDGYGNQVNPEFSERWHWFMTEHSSNHYVPKKSHVYQLKDYE